MYQFGLPEPIDQESITGDQERMISGGIPSSSVSTLVMENSRGKLRQTTPDNDKIWRRQLCTSKDENNEYDDDDHNVPNGSPLNGNITGNGAHNFD